MILSLILCMLAMLHLSSSQDILKQNLYVGQNARLKCGPIERYINIPMTFSWEKPIGNVIGTESLLILDKVSFKDGGTYTCRTTHTINGRVIKKNLTTQLLINSRDTDDTSGSSSPTDSPTLEFSNGNTDSIELTETYFLYSKCSVPNWRNEDYVAQWMRNQRVINNDKTSILFLFPLDAARDSGTYTCQVYHKTIPDQKYERELRITIKNPEVVIEPLTGENLRIGGRIYRRCQIPNGKSEGYESLSYAWMKDNSITVSTAAILDIQINDGSVSGEYSCIVKSLKGEKTYTQSTAIRIGSNNGRTSGDYKVNIGSQPTSPEFNKLFKLSCQLYPPLQNMQYQWLKNDRVVSNDQDFIVPNFQKEDVGSYSCRVTGKDNTDDIMARTVANAVNVRFLYTRDNMIELSERGSQMISKVGEMRELHCEVPVSTNLEGKHVKWYFKEELVDINAERMFNVHHVPHLKVNILSLLNISMRNEGEYRCEVAGVQKSANLLVIEDLISMEINPPRLEIKEGGAIEFHCRVSNLPGFVNYQMRWTYRSRDGTRSADLTNDNSWNKRNSPSILETSFLNKDQGELIDDGFYTCTTPSGLQKTAELVIRPKADNVILTISPEIMTVRVNQPIVIDCFSKSKITGQPTGDPKFFFASGRSIRQDTRFAESSTGPSRTRLSIPSGLGMSDTGMKVECKAGGQTRTATIYLESECPPNYRRCNNGDCLPAGKFCDGVRDCPDGSDEISAVCDMCDPISIKCENNAGIAPVKKMFLVHWKCDGENDCGNNFDESLCTEEDKKCNGMNFRCDDGKVIPRAYQCDRESDCSRSEDEEGCSVPQIRRTAEEKIRRIRRGDNVKLKCESVSNPRSQILWRYNWGCLKDKERMYVSNTMRGCTTVESVLTIRNFQPGDDGIYSCEALSSQSRAFSEDYQLILDSI